MYELEALPEPGEPPPPPRPDHLYREMPRFRDWRNDQLVEVQPGNKLFLGAELEVELMHVMWNTARAEFNGLPFYAKADGSLHNGIEFVSHPLTLDAWRGIEPELSKRLKRLSRKGCRSYSPGTCGLHIHISRAGLVGAAHLYKILAMVYQNPAWSIAFSRRGKNSENLSQYASLDNVHPRDLPRKARTTRDYDFDRYTAVNTCNTNTVEFRLFRGTLSPGVLYQTLEGVVAMVEYTKNCSVEDAAYLPGFRRWMEANAQKYPLFAAWMARDRSKPLRDDHRAENLNPTEQCA